MRMRVTAAVLVFGLGACGGGGTTDPTLPLRGHFTTNATVTGDYTLAIYAVSDNGQVSGYGWAGIPGKPSPPIEPLIVTGQQTGRAVSLTLAIASEAASGGLFGIFSGANENGGLRGTLSRSAQSFGVTFLRTDTTATGQFDLTYSNGPVASVTGRTGFGTKGGFKLEMLVGDEATPILTISGPTLPPVGTTAIGPALSAVLRLPGAVPQTLTSGSIQIDRSSALTVIGQFDGQGTVGRVPVSAHVRFSAGCPTTCN